MACIHTAQTGNKPRRKWAMPAHKGGERTQRGRKELVHSKKVKVNYLPFAGKRNTQVGDLSLGKRRKGGRGKKKVDYYRGPVKGNC